MKSALSEFVLAVLLLSSAPQADIAATASTSFGVSITVEAACVISASSVRVEVFAITPLKAISNVSVICTHPTPYDISIRSFGWAATSSKLAESNAAVADQYLPSYAFISNSSVIPVTYLGVAAFSSADLRDAVARSSPLNDKAATRSLSARIYPDEVTVVVTY